MAKKTQSVVTLTDDLDGSKADRTLAFAFDGADYEIELSKKNATAFEKAIKPYLDAARKTRGATTARGRTSTAKGNGRTRSRNDLAQVRKWANANGLDVSERGRIAKTVQDAYDASH